MCLDGTRLGTDQSCASCGDVCASGATCVSGMCKKPAAAACSGDGECVTGICADGVSTCNGDSDCPYATSGGTCAWGATPMGGCATMAACVGPPPRPTVPPRP